MIQHVALESRREDVPVLIRFWAALGFREVEPPATLAGRTAWVQRGASQVHLLFAEDPRAPASGHVAVVAEDYDATLERLRRAGFEPDPRPEHWGARRSFVRAPGGHLVEVMAAPPPG